MNENDRLGKEKRLARVRVCNCGGLPKNFPLNAIVVALKRAVWLWKPI